MMRSKFLLVLALVVFAVAIPYSAQERKGLAFARVEHLRHGINLSMWYAQTKDFSAGRLDSYTTPQDMKLIRQAGFDHVRLSIDPDWVIADPQTGSLKPEVLARLDRSVKSLRDAGLNVILDIHPEQSFKVPLATGSQGQTRFNAFWTSFAKHFAGTDPEAVFFEVMNEPTIGLDRWQQVQADTISHIRSVAPHHTILATASEYSSIDTLLALEPVQDDNVIYTFHEYNPMWFTHQGATWGVPAWAPLRGIPYPSTPENIQAVLGQETDERQRLRLQEYGWDRWDAPRLGAEVAAAAEWAKRRGVPLYCGEFGVYRAYAKPEARATWIDNVRTALESKHIGWAMWDYQGSFGIVTKGPNGTILDKSVVNALGLKSQ